MFYCFMFYTMRLYGAYTVADGCTVVWFWPTLSIGSIKLTGYKSLLCIM
jgi:hypothetical protein